MALLKGLPYAEKRLVLFQADIYNPCEFEAAIQGCEAVIHMATPLQHNPDSNSQVSIIIVYVYVYMYFDYESEPNEIND